ncbi:MAG: outer membrane lipoprotein-sorting protein [Treponema sp.]|jgi:outer membrane lipoprotein-sorting protein|nr:outer membrane lipoprotein-sorting protein [Treponema sp.]
MKKRFFALWGLLFTASLLFAQDAGEIVRASRDRIRAETISTRFRMVITAKDGSVSERLLDQYSKDGSRGSRTIILFRQPAAVANTRFLTMENAGGADDRWIYLPSLDKVRRIAASEGSGSFMGTDFSYDDISSSDRDADLDTHRLIREETLSGRNCYVIESTPKDSSYQYSKMVLWIDKENLVTHKIDLYDRRGNHVKVLEILKLQEIQGRLSSMETRMTTLGAGTGTSLVTEILKYDDPIPEGVFTTNYLETGRAR